MTAERETSRSIDDRAADWIARLDRGPLSEDENQAFEAWLQGDPRRRGALLRADAAAMLSESAQALGPQFDPRRFAAPEKPRGLSRRTLIALAGTGGTVAALAAIGFSLPAAAITTGLGEVRLVTLDDGSTMMLNTQTSVQVDYGARERRVALLYGEAFFTIVADAHRPFFVDVTGARLRATRARFRVRKLEGRPVDVLVDQGELALAAAQLPAPLTIPAGTRLVVPPDLPPVALPTPQPVAPDLIMRELAWREGKIAFEGEPLDQAAAAFARYSRIRIEIPDAALAREPVAGLFSASDPVGFSRAVAQLFGAEMERRGDVVILRRRADQP
ncbi:FecR domain-containing protein [Sphingomonas sp. HITSZ_GF]|uniref:FecR family protein n=1 Tax=Sphingomonas sp. HITSZ_GF TaxID=3037247 RepID=UPI00240E91B3|nr:FecR domain-containing protein [Sphingomonas sp. HITSZ_GF]MDG2533488.1 FecR domain-containing protein [Sphingomonas sp. HITSZ_GF]